MNQTINFLPNEIWDIIVVYLDYNNIYNLLITFKLLSKKNSKFEEHQEFIQNSLYRKIRIDNPIIPIILNGYHMRNKFTIKLGMKYYNDVYTIVCNPKYTLDYYKRKYNILEAKTLVDEIYKYNPDSKPIKAICGYLFRISDLDIPNKIDKNMGKNIRFIIERLKIN